MPIVTMRSAVLAGLAMLVVAMFPTGTRADISSELKAADKALEAGDYDTAFREYSRAAEERENPLAQFTLALFHQFGWGRAINMVKACQWHERAAQASIPVAQHELGKCFERGIHRPADPAQAAEWYDKAGGMGHLLSFCYLANLYMTGAGVPKDPGKSLALCRRAAERNNAAAQTMMGSLLLQGDESVRDYQAALSWFDLAAQQNDPQAQYYLGVMIRDGLGTAGDAVVARYYFESAAAQGFRDAYYPTAKAYFETFAGTGSDGSGEEALAKAYMWLTTAEKRTRDATEAASAAEMLKKVRAVMPPSWAADLDEKVARHLAEHPEN